MMYTRRETKTTQMSTICKSQMLSLFHTETMWSEWVKGELETKHPTVEVK